MKKAIAILIAVLMIISMIPCVYAVDYTVTTNEYLRYVLEMSGNVNGWPGNSFVTHYPNDTYSGFRTWPAEETTGVKKLEGTVMGKNSDNYVMEMYVGAEDPNGRIDSNGFFDQDGNNDSSFTGYNAGEKVHMSAQYYIPRAESYYSESSKGLRMGLTLYEGDTTTVFNPSTSEVSGTGALITFAPTSIDGGEFYFLGALKADQTWDAETCYTVDAVITFGEEPTLSVYVNGVPLTFGETLVDGVTNTSENVKLNRSSYGIASNTLCSISTVSAPEGKTYVYTDDWVFENLRAGDVPQIYNPVSFADLKDGDSLLINENAEVTVNVDLMDCSEVELFVNDESIGTMSGEPFTFVLPSDLTPGKATLKAVATVGDTTFQNSVSVSLGKSYGEICAYHDFEAYSTVVTALDYGWYRTTSDFYGGGHAPNGWFIEPRTVTDRARKHFDKSFVFGCEAGAEDFWLNNNGDPKSDLAFGYRRFNGVDDKEITGHKVTVSWQMYVETDTISSFNFNLGRTGVDNKRIFNWDNIGKSIKWDVVGDPVYTTPNIGYWQKYELSLDISSSAATKATLEIDGEQIFADRILTNTVASFNNFVWNMLPDLENGSCVGVDEISVIHTVPRPGFGSAVFYQYDGSTIDTTSVSADTTAFAITVNNGLLEEDLEQNIEFLENGEVLTFEDDYGDTLFANVLLIGNKLWIVPPRPLLSNTKYTVRLKAGALFADNATIGYDQDFDFETKTATVDVVSTEYYKNGVKIDDLSDVTFVAGDTIKAVVTLCNGTDSGYPVHILMLGYNGTMLSGYESLSATITAGATDQEVETPEITISSPTEFSATAIVCDSDFLPIADSESVSGNQ